MGILDKNFFDDALWTSIYWRVLPFERGEIDGIPYLAEIRGYGSPGTKTFNRIEDGKREPTNDKINGLPTEFFNHELKDIDSRDDDQIVQFCSKWGIFCSPYFNSYSRFLESSDKQYSSALQQYAKNQSAHLSKIESAIAILSKTQNSEANPLAAIKHATKVLLGQEKPEIDRTPFADFRESKMNDIRRETSNLACNPHDCPVAEYLSDECEAVIKSLYLQTEFTQTDIQETFIDAYDVHPGNIISLDEVRCVLEKLQDIAHIFPIMDAFESTNEILFEITKLIVVDKAPIHSEALHQIAARVIVASNGILPTKLQDADFRFDESNDPIPDLNAWTDSAIRYFNMCISPIFRNAIRSRNSDIFPHFDNSGPFSLQNAICIQLYFELDDNVDWVRCSYSKCNRLFKYQRYSPLPHYYQEGRKSRTKYCCRNHSIYASRQSLREAQKTARSLAKVNNDKGTITEVLQDLYPDLNASQIGGVVEKALCPKLD